MARALLALGSAVFLAWSGQRALDGIELASAREPEQAWTLHSPAAGPQGRNPKARANQLWVAHATVDGGYAGLDSFLRSGTWDLVAWNLTHHDDTPAALGFRCRRAVLHLLRSEWSGIARLTNEQGESTELDLYQAPGDPHRLLVVRIAGNAVHTSVEQPDSEPQVRRTALALLPLLLLLAITRPWRDGRRLLQWSIGHVVALHGLAWITQPIGFNSDGPGYMRTLEGLLQYGQRGYFPPGYPAFLGALASLSPDRHGRFIALVQHGIMVAALLAVRRCTRPFLGSELATLGFLLAGSLAPTVLLPQSILSENLTLGCMAATLWAAARQGVGPAVLAGACLGLGTITRAVPLPALAVPILLLALETRRFGPALWRTTGILVVTLLATALVPALGWLRGGAFALTNSTGLHLYNRVVTEQHLVDPDAAPTRRLTQLLGSPPKPGSGHWDLTPPLMRVGLSFDEAQGLLGAVARAGIRSDPVGFLRYSAALAWRDYCADPMPLVPRWRGDSPPWPGMEEPPLTGANPGSWRWRDDLEATFAALWSWLQWLPLLAVAVVPLLAGGRLRLLALFLVPAGYLGTTALVEYFLERYVAGVLPFLLPLAVAPLALVLRGGLAPPGSRPASPAD